MVATEIDDDYIAQGLGHQPLPPGSNGIGIAMLDTCPGLKDPSHRTNASDLDAFEQELQFITRFVGIAIRLL